MKNVKIFKFEGDLYEIFSEKLKYEVKSDEARKLFYLFLKYFLSVSAKVFPVRETGY